MLWWGLPAFIPASFVRAKPAELVVKRIAQEKFRLVIARFLLLATLKLLVWL